MEKKELQDSGFIYVPKEEQEQEVDVRQYGRVFWERKWIIILTFLIFAASTVFYLLRTEPVYEAKVVMVYEKANPANGVLENINPIQPPAMDLEAKKVFLTSAIVTDEIQNRLRVEREELTEEQIIKLLKLSNTKSSNSSVVELIAQGGTPGVASLLANTAASVLIKRSTEDKRQELDGAVNFLSSQMERFDKLLETTEGKLAQFRQKEGVPVSREKSSSLLEKLGNMQEEATQAEIEAGLAKAQLDAVQGQIVTKRKNLSPEAQEVGSTTTPQIEVLRGRILQLQNDLFSKQGMFTDEHPQVVALKEKIKVAQKQLNDEIARLGEIKGDPISEWQNLTAREVQLDITYQGLAQKKTMLNSLVEKFKQGHPELASKDVQLLRFERERDLYKQSYLQLQSRYTEMSLLQEMKGTEMRVIKAADEKSAVIVKPKKRMTLALGAVLGLFLGFGSAFFAEFLDNTIKTRKSAQEATGLPVVGVIPDIPYEEASKNKALKALKEGQKKNVSANDNGKISKKKSDLIEFLGQSLLYLDPKSPVAEGYRALMATLRFAISGNGHGEVKTILITSSVPGEGKTTTVVGLAITLARSGSKILIVDADLHHPRIHEIFGFQKSTIGFADLIINKDNKELSSLELSSFMKKTTVENLWVITSGKLPPNPGDLLAQDIKPLLESLKREFDFIIFDSAPELVSDATVLAPKMDTSLLVLRAGSTRKPAVLRTKDTLTEAGAKPFGVVLTFMSTKNREEYPYHREYKSYYTKES